MMTLSEIKTILDYDTESGVLIWKRKTCQKVIVGSRAGTKRHDGYIIVRINGIQYYAHRLIWLLVNGEWPINQIDHKDLDPSNNRITNLRLATNSENQRNKSKPSNNKTGVKGVIWDSRKNKFVAQLRNGRKHIHIGYFDEILEAQKAIKKERNYIHLEFSNHGML
jgi:hypothetical protein